MATWTVHLKEREVIKVKAFTVAIANETVCFLNLANTTVFMVPVDNLAYVERQPDCECCEESEDITLEEFMVECKTTRAELKAYRASSDDD